MWIVSYYVAGIRCMKYHDNTEDALKDYNKLIKDFCNVDCVIVLDGKEHTVLWQYTDDFKKGV